MAVELGDRLSKCADIALPVDLVRESSSAIDLARFILEKLLIQMTSRESGAHELLAESGGEGYRQEIL